LVSDEGGVGFFGKMKKNLFSVEMFLVNMKLSRIGQPIRVVSTHAGTNNEKLRIKIVEVR
jgi:hypothetical protein